MTFWSHRKLSFSVWLSLASAPQCWFLNLHNFCSNLRLWTEVQLISVIKWHWVLKVKSKVKNCWMNSLHYITLWILRQTFAQQNQLPFQFIEKPLTFVHQMRVRIRYKGWSYILWLPFFLQSGHCKIPPSICVSCWRQSEVHPSFFDGGPKSKLRGKGSWCFGMPLSIRSGMHADQGGRDHPSAFPCCECKWSWSRMQGF